VFETRREAAVYITLSTAEVDLLLQMVEKDIHELVMEIAKADSRDYREGLKAKATILEGVRAKLEAGSSG
jgi:hypothetical protein